MPSLYLGGICFITGAHPRLDAVGQAEAAFRGGIKCVQLREKNAPRKKIYEEALRIKELAVKYGAALVVNDYPDIAAASGADGVHLGREDLPVKEARATFGGFIGASTHSMSEALQALEDGADYIAFGPLFRTKTKDAGRPKGLARLARIKRAAGTVPVMAVGGITAENAESVFSAGADALAVSGGILSPEAGVLENSKKLAGIAKKCGA